MGIEFSNRHDWSHHLVGIDSITTGIKDGVHYDTSWSIWIIIRYHVNFNIQIEFEFKIADRDDVEQVSIF